MKNSDMKKIAVISTVCVVLVTGLFMLFGNSSGLDTPVSDQLRDIEIED